MKQSQLIRRLLFPPRQDAAEPVHPTVRPFDHPTPGLEAGLALDRLGFLAPSFDVGGISEFLHQVADPIVVVSFVQAHALRMIPRRLGTFDGHALQGGFHHFGVVPVGTVNRQSNRNSRSFGQHATFDAVFGSIRGVGAGFFPRPTGPWSSRRPSTAKTSRCLSVRRTPVGLGPRASEKPRRRSISGTTDGPPNSNRFRWRLARSIGSPSVTRRRPHSWPSGQALADCGSPADGACQLATTVRSSPTGHPGFATCPGTPPCVRSSSWSSLISCGTSMCLRSHPAK